MSLWQEDTSKRYWMHWSTLTGSSCLPLSICLTTSIRWLMHSTNATAQNIVHYGSVALTSKWTSSITSTALASCISPTHTASLQQQAPLDCWWQSGKDDNVAYLSGWGKDRSKLPNGQWTVPLKWERKKQSSSCWIWWSHFIVGGRRSQGMAASAMALHTHGVSR